MQLFPGLREFALTHAQVIERVGQAVHFRLHVCRKGVRHGA